MSSVRDLFLRPDAWPLLLVVPCVLLIVIWTDRRRVARIRAGVGIRAERVGARARGRRRGFAHSLGTLGLLLLALAGMQPRLGAVETPVFAGGLDIVVCLDVSRSMHARDAAPDRLTRAKREIAALARVAEGDAMALVLFAGEAARRVPLTRDLASLVAITERAGPADVARGGSDVARALSTAAKSLPTGGGTVILLTDGEDHGAAAGAVAGSLAERGIVLHAVAIGSERGARIPTEDPDGGPLTDASGRPVLSRVDVAGLARLTATSGGRTVRSTTGPLLAPSLYREEVAPRARRTKAEQAGLAPQAHPWPLLFGAFLFVFLSALMAGRGLPARGARRRMT